MNKRKGTRAKQETRTKQLKEVMDPVTRAGRPITSVEQYAKALLDEG